MPAPALAGSQVVQELVARHSDSSSEQGRTWPGTKRQRGKGHSVAGMSRNWRLTIAVIVRNTRSTGKSTGKVRREGAICMQSLRYALRRWATSARAVPLLLSTPNLSSSSSAKVTAFLRFRNNTITIIIGSAIVDLLISSTL